MSDCIGAAGSEVDVRYQMAARIDQLIYLQ